MKFELTTTFYVYHRRRFHKTLGLLVESDHYNPRLVSAAVHRQIHASKMENAPIQKYSKVRPNAEPLGA